MADQTVVRTLIIRGKSEGVDQVARQTENLAKSLEHVAIATDTAAKRTLSVQGAYDRQTRSLDQVAKAQFNIGRATTIADQALKQGLITQSEHAARLQLINRSYQIATGSNNAFTQQAKLSRYELINLSRQIQDVGVSLASGQSPLTVLVQQGTQIADVFAASSGTVGGFFKQVTAGAAAIFTPFRAIAAGATAIAAAGLLIANNWENTSIAINRALSGMGRVSGATEKDIIGVGQAVSSLTGLSQSAGRELAGTFAQAGVNVKNLGSAVRVADDLAKQFGISSAEGAKLLATSLAGGRLEIEKLLDRLGANTAANREFLRSLDQTADKTRLHAAALDLVAQNTERAADRTSAAEKIFNALKNTFRDFVFPQIGDAGSGRDINAQVASQQQSLDQLIRWQNEAVKAGQATSDYAVAIDEAIQKLAQLTLQQEQINNAADASKLANITNQLRPLIDAAQPAIEQIKQLDQAIRLLQEAAANPKVTAQPGFDLATLQRSVALFQFQRETIRETAAAEQRRVAIVTQLQAVYGGVTQATAVALQAARDQLVVARARTGQEQLAAQEIARANQLIMQGVSAYEALRIAAAERAVAEAQISTQFENQIENMQLQTKIMEAQGTATEAKLRAELAYNQAIQQGATVAQAAAIAAETKKQGELQFARNAERGVSALRQQVESAQELFSQFVRLNNFTDPGFAPIDGSWLARPSRSLDSAFGGPSKQTFGKIVVEVTDLKAFTREVELFGRTGFEIVKAAQQVTTVAFRDVNTVTFPGQVRPNEEGLRNIVDQILSEGGTLRQAMDVLRSGMFKGKKILGIDDPEAQKSLSNVLQDLARRIGEELGNPQAEMDFIRSEIERLRQQPRTLARDDAIKELNDRLRQLSGSTDDLNDTIGGVLSPLYSQDPRTSRIGFRSDSGPLRFDPFRPNGPAPTQIIINQTPIAPPAPVAPQQGNLPTGPNPTWPNTVPSPTYTDTNNNFYQPNRYIPNLGTGIGHSTSRGVTGFARGGIMGPFGMLPLSRYQSGGIHTGTITSDDWAAMGAPGFAPGMSGYSGVTRSPTLFMTSENYHPEAIIPLEGGAVPVKIAGGREQRGNTIIINNEMIFEATPGAADGLRRTAFQAAEEIGRQVHQVAGRA